MRKDSQYQTMVWYCNESQREITVCEHEVIVEPTPNTKSTSRFSIVTSLDKKLLWGGFYHPTSKFLREHEVLIETNLNTSF